MEVEAQLVEHSLNAPFWKKASAKFLKFSTCADSSLTIKPGTST